LYLSLLSHHHPTYKRIQVADAPLAVAQIIGTKI